MALGPGQGRAVRLGFLAMTLPEIAAFIRRQALATQSTISPAGAPQSAVIGIVSDDAAEIFFDTLASTRKCQNLRRDPRIALVIGWDLAEGRTVQLEGLADEPSGGELERWRAVYFARFPDGVGRSAWPGITYFRVRPTWLRYSDFSGGEPIITELAGAALSPPR